MTSFDLFCKSDALLSECGRYRYWLTRVWDPSRPIICWIMLNPSTADAEQDDPTIRRCMGFAKDWSFGGIVVVNLFALRATDPRELLKHPHPIAPPDVDGFHGLRRNINDAHIIQQSNNRRVIAAWGADGRLHNRDIAVMRLLQTRPVECLGFTKRCAPRHPLYLSADTEPKPLIFVEGHHHDH